MGSTYLGPDSNLLAVAMLSWWVLTIVAHIAFAIGVAIHSRRRSTSFVPAPIWALATLVGGPVIALCYWLVNESSLAVRHKPPEPTRAAFTGKPRQSGARG